jgi:CheY-like chemotaxis protein
MRGSEAAENEASDVASVEDSDLTAAPEEVEESEIPVSGRWLVRDGSRIGMELRFSHTVAHLDSDIEIEQQEGSHRQRTVLITDDDDSMVELLTGMIDSLGDDTLTAADRDRAQERLRNHDVDVVVISAGMGGGTGWNVARWFKDANPQLPVVLVVGAETMTIPDDVPCDRVLCLPFQLDELRDCLDTLTVVKA